MNATREAILAAVREAAACGSAPEPVARTYRRDGTRSRRERTALFAERVGDYRATVRHVAAEQLQQAIGGLAPGRVGIPPRLPHALRPTGAVEDHGLTPQELDALDGVVTGCTLAIAETGTIVLSGGSSEGRRALTLVPDLHLCVVRPGQIVETVPQAFSALRDSALRPLTFVSGPSATSDIELERVEGVHGPRNLIVVIVEEEEDD
ncbi:MAG TPA: LUD domain-containing protein [Gaiellaceae bacterium]